MQKYEIYQAYRKATNMTYNQVLDWVKNPLSQTASLRPSEDSEEARKERTKLFRYLPYSIKKNSRYYSTAQLRTLILTKLNFKDWDDFLLTQSKKAVAYIKRAKKGKGVINRRALMNWGFAR